jgi:hypothetical protein
MSRGAGQGCQFLISEMAQWPSIKPAVDLNVFRENAEQ